MQKSIFSGALAAMFLAVSPVMAAQWQTEITVAAGKKSPSHAPAVVSINLPQELADATLAKVTWEDGRADWGQITHPSLAGRSKLTQPTTAATDGQVARELWLLVDGLSSKETIRATVTVNNEPTSSDTAPTFHWQDTAGKHTDLVYNNRVLLRYMYEALDPNRRDETFKPYHHVFAPDGKTLLTKGPGGLFPHHRGIFFGFNRITYGNGKKADTWHCKDKAYQSHIEVVRQEAGPVLARQLVKIGWHGQDGEIFAEELRELTVYRQPITDQNPTGTLIEFAAQLSTTGDEIKLDGDPQHAGVQFRSPIEVAEKTKGQTYYVRTDGVGKPGEFRNWPDRKDQVNFPWKGLSIVVGGQRYTIANLDHPNNPKEARFSERDYGRFGSYFTTKVTPDHPLYVNYRFWVQPGEMAPDQIAALADAFVKPPVITLPKK